MIQYRELSVIDVDRIREIDRSETIDYIYRNNDGPLVEIEVCHECQAWDEELIAEIKQRFAYELSNGGFAYGAFDQQMLVGFGVLGNRFRGKAGDQLQVDLMYVSRNYRRQGIGTRILEQLTRKAKERGAEFLYISSTETRSAVFFYKSNGSRITDEVDQELFAKEPYDIHMTIRIE
jgi:GNAT superfamily N-acetyltransferase